MKRDPRELLLATILKTFRIVRTDNKSKNNSRSSPEMPSTRKFLSSKRILKTPLMFKLIYLSKQAGSSLQHYLERNLSPIKQVHYIHMN